MTINLPPKVRAGLYIFFAVGSPFIVYLRVINVISDNEVSLWTGLGTVISGLAALNVDTRS